MKILPSNRYINNTAMLDLIFLLLMSVLMMFVILLAILKTKTSIPAVEDVNTYVIQMTWDDESRADVDMWVLDPTNAYVSYKKKSAPGMRLTRDDLGMSNDTVIRADGSADVLLLNQEVVNIRQWKPGRYYVNAHMFNIKSSDPVEISVKLIRVTPFSEYESQTFTMSANGQEHTMITFDISQDGTLELFPAIQYPFILDKKKASGPLSTNSQGTGGVSIQHTPEVFPDTEEPGG